MWRVVLTSAALILTQDAAWAQAQANKLGTDKLMLPVEEAHRIEVIIERTARLQAQHDLLIERYRQAPEVRRLIEEASALAREAQDLRDLIYRRAEVKATEYDIDLTERRLVKKADKDAEKSNAKALPASTSHPD